MLLPGDPGRALLLAQSLLDEPKMFNHNRGLWGYTGTATDGELLTIQSTGMGGPSAAIVISELADLGASRLLRVGTCGGLDASLALGELLFAGGALAADGTSQALGAAGVIDASMAFDGPERTGLVVSTDLFYAEPSEEWLALGAIAVEMEAATLFALARMRELEAGAVLIVSDLVSPIRQRIGPEELRDAEHRLGELAVRTLTHASRAMPRDLAGQ